MFTATKTETVSKARNAVDSETKKAKALDNENKEIPSAQIVDELENLIKSIYTINEELKGMETNIKAEKVLYSVTTPPYMPYIPFIVYISHIHPSLYVHPQSPSFF